MKRMLELSGRALGALRYDPDFAGVRRHLVRALVVTVLFGISSAAGLVEYTSVISGTSPSGDPADTIAVILGLAHAGIWFAFVLGVPVFLLAAAIHGGFGFVLKRHRANLHL